MKSLIFMRCPERVKLYEADKSFVMLVQEWMWQNTAYRLEKEDLNTARLIFDAGQLLEECLCAIK